MNSQTVDGGSIQWSGTCRSWARGTYRTVQGETTGRTKRRLLIMRGLPAPRAYSFFKKMEDRAKKQNRVSVPWNQSWELVWQKSKNRTLRNSQSSQSLHSESAVLHLDNTVLQNTFRSFRVWSFWLGEGFKIQSQGRKASLTEQINEFNPANKTVSQV